MTMTTMTSAEAESIRPTATIPFERRRSHGVTCVVESCRGMLLTGWALVQPWQPAQIDLWLGQRLLPARLTRIHRPDVLSHLGADPKMDLALGFRIELPSEVWEAQDDSGSTLLHLAVDGVDADMPSFRLGPDDLELWQHTLVWYKDAGTCAAEWERLSQHLRFHLTPQQLEEAHTQALEAWAARDASQARATPSLRWAIEETGDLSVRGWVVQLQGGEERFEILCNGLPVTAAAVRHERSDVQQALGAVKLNSGFELPLPATIWGHIPAGRQGHLQVLVAGEPLLDGVLTRGRTHLVEALRRWRLSGAPLADTPDEHRYRALTVVEHLLAADVLPELPAEDLKFLADAAAAEGITLGIPSSVRVEPAHQAIARELWQLQRRLNGLLPPAPFAAEVLEAALDQTLAELQESVSPGSVSRFLVTLTPGFCTLDALPRLRERLPADELEVLAASQGRWEQSMMLPITLLDELAGAEGRLTATCGLLERLVRTADGGWTETAALRDTWRRLARTVPAQPVDDADLLRALDLSLQLFDSLGHGPTSRVSDDNLMAGMCELLAAARHLGEAMVERVALAAVRHYGMQPGFWTLVRQASGPGGALQGLHSLQSASDNFAQVVRLLPQLKAGQAEVVDPCCLALAQTRHLGCLDVDAVHRHALLLHAALGSGDEQAQQARRLLQGLHPHESLRWLSRLDAETPAAWPLAAVSQVLFNAAPAAPVANIALRKALYSSHGDALAAAVALCGQTHGFFGLRWLADQAFHRSEACSQALWPCLTRAIDVCTRDRAHYPAPPAVLCSVLDLAYHTLATPREEPAASFVAWSREALELTGGRMRDLWPGQADPSPLPVTPVVPVRTPGIGRLVVVRSHAGHGQVVPSHVSDGFGKDLAQAGIPWVIWQVQQGPVGFTDTPETGARGRVHAPSLLSLLVWLVEHSDFGHLLLVDDDLMLDVQAWLCLSGGPAHHYHGAALQVPLAGAPGTLDKSPRATRFASSEHGLGLSRHAAERALQLRSTARGAQLARDSFDEEKYLADLLRLAEITLSEEGHVVHPRRPPGPGRHAFGYLSFHPPGPGMPTVLTHVEPAEVAGPAPGRPARLSPRRLWPTDRLPAFDNHGRAMALVELSAPAKADALQDAPCMVVAAARNEATLLPHFLAHYRALGVRHFAIVDNLSTDGSREYLLDQPDVAVYSADSPYSLSRYGVAWQQTVLSAHATGQWALVADIDEFLSWPGCEHETLPALCERLGASGADAACVLMVDMYPEGRLEDADFGTQAPFEAANCFDAQAALRWELGSGHFSNMPTWVSGLRHRLLPDSPPNHYTSQKVALMKHAPWVRCSEGLHYAAGLTLAPQLLAFAHFKFHRGFHAKVVEEVRRAEHYNAAEEYRQYQALLTMNSGSFFDPAHSRRYSDSRSFAELLQ